MDISKLLVSQNHILPAAYSSPDLLNCWSLLSLSSVLKISKLERACSNWINGALKTTKLSETELLTIIAYAINADTSTELIFALIDIISSLNHDIFPSIEEELSITYKRNLTILYICENFSEILEQHAIYQLRCLFDKEDWDLETLKLSNLSRDQNSDAPINELVAPICQMTESNQEIIGNDESNNPSRTCILEVGECFQNSNIEDFEEEDKCKTIKAVMNLS